MAQNKPENDSKTWKKFLRKHWNMFALFIVGVILASIGAVLVFLGFSGDAQLTGLVPASLGLWSMGHLVTFLLNLVFWEAILIGIPVGLAVAAGWLWWKNLPSREKKEYRFSGNRSRAASGGGPMSLIIFIAFCIKIFVDGNWNVPVASWTFDYFIYSVLTVVLWMLVVFGIPLALGFIWWLHREIKKKS